MSARRESSSSDDDEESLLPPPPLPPPPAKGILKKTSSTVIGATSGTVPPPQVSLAKKKKKKRDAERKKSARFDEMNIIATLHPVDKEYGYDVIDEPKTPYNWEDGEGTSTADRESVSAVDLASKLLTLGSTMPTVVQNPAVPNSAGSSTSLADEVTAAEDESLTDEERKKRMAFQLRRKAHYDEFKVVKKMTGTEDSDQEGDDEDSKKRKRKNK